MENETHRVILKSISQMFGPFVADIIGCEVECSECLDEKVKMERKDIRKEWNSLCYFEKHQPDVGPLLRRYY